MPPKVREEKRGILGSLSGKKVAAKGLPEGEGALEALQGKLSFDEPRPLPGLPPMEPLETAQEAPSFSLLDNDEAPSPPREGSESFSQEAVVEQGESPGRLRMIDGKEPMTLQELRAALNALDDETFAKAQEQGLLKEWAVRNGGDETFARRISKAASAQEAVAFIDKQHAKQVRDESEEEQEPPQPVIIEPEEHFEKLSDEYRQALRELVALVNSKDAREFASQQQVLVEDKELIESLEQLVHAVEIMNDETYEQLSADKQSFIEWVKELAQKAVAANNLQPAKVQQALIKQIGAYAQKLERRIEDEKEAIRLTMEKQDAGHDKLAELDVQLREKEVRLSTEQQQLAQQQELWSKHRKEVEERLKGEQDEARRIVEEQRAATEALKREHGQVEQQLADKQSLLGQRKGELESLEKDIAARSEKAEADIKSQYEALRKEQELFGKERSALEKEKRELEKSMGEREALVQGVVNRIVETDNDIKEQRASVERIRQDLDKGGFKAYLRDRLKNIDTDHVFLYDHTKSPLMEKQPRFYELIEECNKALEAQKFDEAKRRYDELKDTYEQAKLNDEERHLVYDAIKELYTTIRIAKLTK